MKTLALLTGLLATALAAPTPPSSYKPTQPLFQCPANAFQPNGKLPRGTISTSALVPISAKQPNRAFPASSIAKVTPNDLCTIFNLELPVAATQGKICTLVFDFPSLAQAPGLFSFSGPGHFQFLGYDINAGAVPGVTTFNNQPRDGPDPPTPPPVITPGHSYVVNSAPCGIPPSIPGFVTVSGALCSQDTTLVFRQSDRFCPLGFFVVLSDA